MTFLAPALLALGAFVAVPLVLHLLHRHRAPRVSFPAVRYLRRAEREHATRIRLRQLLLLGLRVLGVSLLAMAAARPFLAGDRGAHPATAVALVLDNSLSSGAVVNDRRTLDGLKAAARAALAAAGPDDVFWLLRAGAPWEPAIRGNAAQVARDLEATVPTAGMSDLGAALNRARGILSGAGPGAREIHLLSDLQATAFATPPVEGTFPPIRVLIPADDPPPNRWVGAVEVGGGLPPRAGERFTVAAAIAGAGDSVDVRLSVDGSVRAVERGPVGGSVVLPLPAHGPGRVTGNVEIDRDALAADDRRWFAVEVATPPSVSLPASLPFLDEALDVLAEAGRIRRARVQADVGIAPAGVGADAVRRGTATLILPPSTPLERTAANRRLADAGIPWRLEPPLPGEARVDTQGLGLGVLAGVRLRQVYRLVPAGSGGDATLGAGRVLARLRSGEPWAVGGRGVGDAAGRYVLLATPLTPAAGTLPTSAAMLPFLDRALTVWLADGVAAGSRAPGDVVTVVGDSLIHPDGSGAAVEPGALVRLTEPGIYRVMAGDNVTGTFAVNPAPSESDLRRLPVGSAGLPGDVRAADLAAWPDVIYHRRLGRETTVALLVVALAVLLLESAVAASGRAG